MALLVYYPEDVSPPEPTHRMALRINNVHIRGLKAIKELNLPEDGFLWEGRIPDVVVVGGVNGSGKTTLLEFLWNAIRTIGKGSPTPVDVSIRDDQLPHSARLDCEVDELQFGWTCAARGEGVLQRGLPQDDAGQTASHRFAVDVAGRELANGGWKQHMAQQRAVLFDSDRRLVTFGDKLHTEADLENREVAVRWTAPVKHEHSFGALLQSARWQDFNLEKAGRAAEATNEAALTAAFHAVTDGEKRIVWPDGGKLRVELKDGTTHTLDELSSGEKQLIIFSAHLRNLWKPGSLIFIDEPEAHLHDVWQTKLYEIICDWQKELGGQVWMATQSAHFFGLAEVGRTLTLGGKILGVR